MSFQICIRTEKPLQQLAGEIRELFSLPPFSINTFSGDEYCQFEVLGLLILLHKTEEEDRDPEVMHYPYSFDMQMSFVDHDLDTDTMEYRLQPYYAQLLSFQLGLDTAYHEKQKVDRKWHIRYRYCSRNPKWNANVLYGEPGWEPAVLQSDPSPWRNMHPVF
jgi:hypothetical protein